MKNRDPHNEVVRAQFALQAVPFSTALHANDPELLNQYLRLIALQPGERVVDFCSGPGIVAARLAGAGCVVCLDVTHEMLLEARKRAPQALLVESHAGRAPFARSTGSISIFDIAVSRLSLHHVQRPEEVVLEMARVVAPGGRVVINDIVTSENKEESAYTERIERLRDPSHTRCLTGSELERLCIACGLRTTAALSHDAQQRR
ncbi:MAG: methyltransferase domain-containing protein [Candidatus Hydrogenedentota bacterium]